MPFILGDIRMIVAQPLPSEAAKITVKSRLAAACDNACRTETASALHRKLSLAAWRDEYRQGQRGDAGPARADCGARDAAGRYGLGFRPPALEPGPPDHGRQLWPFPSLPAAGPRLLVADSVQRASLLPPERAEPLLAGCQEQELHPAGGSLTLTASATPPDDDELRSNWLPALPWPGRSRCTCAPTGPSSRSSTAPGHHRRSSRSAEARGGRANPVSRFASRRHVTPGGDRVAGFCRCHLVRVRRPLPAARVLSRTV